MVEDAGLVAEIQARGWLVHDEEARLPGESPGNEDELALATADLRVTPLGQMPDTEGCQGLEGDRRVRFAGRREGTEAARPAPSAPRPER